LTEKGIKESGACWCPNCANQKNLFGKSFKYVTYVECDARGTNAQPQLCKENNIKGYPTWIINGTFVEGTQSLEELSRLSDCNI
jgi:glutaredoxin